MNNPLPVVLPKKSHLSLILLILLCLSFLLVSILAYQYYQLKHPLAQTQVLPTPTPFASPTIAELTFDWKTYTNEQYGFSFKQPHLDDSCCGLDGAISENPVYLIALADKSTVVSGKKTNFDGLAVYVVSNQNNLTLEQYLEKEKSALIEEFNNLAEPNQTHQGKIESIVVAGQPAISLINYSWDKITRTYFKHPYSQAIIEISQNEQSPRHFFHYPLILSTFKFTSPAAASPSQECQSGSILKQCKAGPCCCPVGALCD